MKKLIICVSGPSGVGKGTLVKELLLRNPSLAYSVSCTTRAPREGEREGIDYHFITREEFERIKAENGFIEWDDHFDYSYGTPEKFVLDELEKGSTVLLEIDVVGSAKVVERYRGTEIRVALIMVVPPSMEELGRRLKGRGSEDDTQVKIRSDRASYELGKRDSYDYVVVNDDKETAVREIERIISEEKNRAERSNT